MRFLWPVIGLCACWWTIAECAGESDASMVSQVPQWRLSQRPLLDIGVASGDPVYELTDAASSLRLPDGGVVVADVGAGELRYFDATGRYRMTSDATPAEGRQLASRRGRLQLADPKGGGVIFEGAGRRLSFDDEGRLIGERAGTEPMARIHRRTLILGGSREAQSRAVAALDRMPAVDSMAGYQIVHLDNEGYLWVEGRLEESSVRRPWRVHAPDGRLVGRAATLAAFEPQEIGRDFMLGRWRDGNGIEHIRMYSLTREERPVRGADSVAAAPRPVSRAQRAAAVAAIRRVLQELVMSQEGYWSKTMTYASDPAVLTPAKHEGVEIAIISSGVAGWRAVAYVHAADAMCAIGVGRDAVPGWEEGRPVCS